MTTATKKDPPTIPADTEHVITLTAAQVAQHPANLRDPVRDIDRLAASISGVGVLVPLIVVPVNQVPASGPRRSLMWPSTGTAGNSSIGSATSNNCGSLSTIF